MKKKQRKVKKPAPKAAPRKRAPKAAPKAAAASAAKAITFPVLVHVHKAGDKIPVNVADQAHLDRLRAEHGDSSVQVQS